MEMLQLHVMWQLGPEYNGEHLIAENIRVLTSETAIIRRTWKAEMLSHPLHRLKITTPGIGHDKCAHVVAPNAFSTGRTDLRWRD
jgi:hypothetical protein